MRFYVAGGLGGPYDISTVPVEKIGPGSPIAWQGFDENGNYGVRYESGAETWISRELLEAEMEKREKEV